MRTNSRFRGRWCAGVWRVQCAFAARTNNGQVCHRDSTAAGCSGVVRLVVELENLISKFLISFATFAVCICVLVYACTYLLTYYRLCCCNPLIIFMLGIVLCVRAKAPKVMQQLVYMTCNLQPSILHFAFSFYIFFQFFIFT